MCMRCERAQCKLLDCITHRRVCRWCIILSRPNAHTCVCEGAWAKSVCLCVCMYVLVCSCVCGCACLRGGTRLSVRVYASLCVWPCICHCACVCVPDVICWACVRARVRVHFLRVCARVWVGVGVLVCVCVLVCLCVCVSLVCVTHARVSVCVFYPQKVSKPSRACVATICPSRYVICVTNMCVCMCVQICTHS